MSAPGLAAVVVMGVSGCGKTTVARALAERLRWPFVEGDDLHPPANIAKMKAGQPLTDEDRAPWLAAIAARIDDWRRAGRAGVVTCSALKRAYRDRLRTGSLLPLREKEAPAREAGGRMRGRADLSASPNIPRRGSRIIG
jgi:carbohydrate kinase (thermoresistant glucokinase family)